MLLTLKQRGSCGGCCTFAPCGRRPLQRHVNLLPSPRHPRTERVCNLPQRTLPNLLNWPLNSLIRDHTRFRCHPVMSFRRFLAFFAPCHPCLWPRRCVTPAATNHHHHHTRRRVGWQRLGGGCGAAPGPAHPGSPAAGPGCLRLQTPTPAPGRRRRRRRRRRRGRATPCGGCGGCGGAAAAAGAGAAGPRHGLAHHAAPRLQARPDTHPPTHHSCVPGVSRGALASAA